MKAVPFFAHDKQTLIYADGSFGTGFRLKGADISTAAPEVINAISQKLESLLARLPEGVKLQVFYRLTNNAHEILKNHAAVSLDPSDVYVPVRNARLDFLTKKMANDAFFIPEIYLFLRSAPLALPKRKFFEKEQVFSGFPAREFAAAKDRFSILVSQVESSLISSGVSPRILSSAEWYSVAFPYFNLERTALMGAPDLRDPLSALAPGLREQLLLTDISIGENELKIGNLLFRVVSLGVLPEGETYSSMIEALQMPFHFWISQNIHALNQRKEIEALELRRRIASSMAGGSNNVADLESESKLSSIEELLREVMNGSERLVSSDLNVILWGTSEEELERKCEEILRAFRSMNQAEGLQEKFALADAFFGAAPGVCEGFRHKKMKTSNCAHLMPIYANWTGSTRPVVLLTNREGTPFSIDPFAEELPNWNGLVFGGSGAGKSFTIAQLMLQFCGQSPRPKIVWIDNGASSEKLIEVMDGEFIDLHLDSGIRLNMFDLDPGETTPSSSKIKLILGCLELILKDEDKPGLPKREKALLEEAIFSVYAAQGGQIPTLSDLKALLARHPVKGLRRYADILFSWTGETAFGRLLDGATNVKLAKDLVSIEIKGLDNHPELKDIFLLLLTSHIKSEAAADLSRPYLLIIDEAQRLFKGSEMGREFAIDSFRVFRKYKAGIWCISQNYKDFLSDPELADSLMPNTPFVFILRQRKIDWGDFKSTFDFNDAQVEAVKSLEIVKGKYSEFFFMQDEREAVVRVEPEPLSYWICTSDGSDKARVAAMRTQNPELPLIDHLTKLSRGDA